MSNWWNEPMRVMQYNLQVRDTPMMDPETIARETEELECNVVVMNMGGIYAWYPSKVPYHHINEFLPKGRDLIKELVDAFHKRNIKFVARFDFSITDDVTYLRKPQWFARHKDKSPYYRGEKRMGEWSLFMNTCALGGYRNEEVAAPVMREAVGNYDIDGVFLNAPHPSACFCERCQTKYMQKYGHGMPDDPMEFEDDWFTDCMKENISTIYKAIKETREEVPLILYYAPFSNYSKSFGRFDRDSIYDRYLTADLICTESQNVLSRGVHSIPDTIHPVMAMKSGQLPDRSKLPFGIIHSCPGMDWRHVGMPVAEYLPWMAQVPASGGALWHSVTGYPLTITDKRVLKACGQIDHMIVKSEKDMHGAMYRSNVCMLWNGDTAAKGWAEGLVKGHIQFDLMHDYDFKPERLSKYGTVLVPQGYKMTEEVVKGLTEYMENGGNVIAEVTDENTIANNAAFYGVKSEVYKSEYLLASYIRFEQDGEALKKGMDTDKIEFRGETCYVFPAEDTKTMATLVPPFAPYEVVGAPPERASMPVPQTDIPLITKASHGKGSIILMPFSLSGLLTEYHLSDHYDLIVNMFDLQLGDKKDLIVKAPHDVQVTMYEKENKVMINMVNEVGQRPLLDNIPVHGIKLTLPVPEGKTVKEVKSVIEETDVTYEVKDGYVTVSVPSVTVWDMVTIEF